MKLLNLCCGAVRPQSTTGVEWVNVDNLYATILPGTPERENLDKETNYVNCDLENDGWPFHAEEFDGILASHCFEHWDCQTAARLMGVCRSILKPGGTLLVSVPDASYFREVHDQDTVENAQEFFGEPIHLPDGATTFFGYGLWNRWHKAILTEDALWAYFVRAGFKNPNRVDTEPLIEQSEMEWPENDHGGHPILAMADKLNRLQFSLVMCGVKE